MQTAATDSLVGRKLEGRYRILERIARGGMSTVYAAVDERLDRLVAVKVMAPALSTDPAFSDRFAREARAAARLTHLNAVSVFDQGREPGPHGDLVFLVMELVEGRTLREVIRERGKLPPAEAISIMEPVLSALAAAHRAGLVHRDVKPENILISDEGVVKVADFGLARAVESDPTSTRTGLMMGTVAYCAPEQISRGAADPRADVYSAGVVLFELLTGSPPFTGESAMNVAYQHVHSRVPAPSSRVRGIPSEVDEVVVAATDSDPAGRPEDAGEFLAELADVRTELALPVTPVPPRPRPRRPTRPEPRYDSPVDRMRTDHLHGASPNHDTSVDPLARPQAAAPRRADAPPPPIVIPPPGTRRPHRRRRAVIITLLVLALAIGAFFGGRAVVRWKFTHVPDVRGLSTTQALHKLKDAGYHPVAVGRTFSATVPKGDVITTSPRWGTRLTTGRTVSYTVSAGPKPYALPSLAGESFTDAVRKLQALGLTRVNPTPRKQYSESVPIGDVIKTSPPAGNKVTADHAVTIYVSNGKPFFTVPSIAAGTQQADAENRLRDSDGKFRPMITEQFSDSVDKDDVISISPTGSQREGTKITVIVSKGPEIVTVPDIKRGASVADAEAAVRQAGLEPQVQNLLGAGGNRVYSTDPEPGTKVHVGTVVTLYVIDI